MIKPILSALVATTAIASPVAAGSLHDFTPEAVRPQTAQQTVPNGNCYATKDDSKVCYMVLKDRVYVVAIQDTDYPSHPAAMTIDCNSGQWKSFSNMPRQQMAVWASSFCKEH